jgi:hypothetical protein
VIRDFLNRCLESLSEVQLGHLIEALAVSIDYAAEFNANLGLRERLRSCGLMQPFMGQQHPSRYATPPS